MVMTRERIILVSFQRRSLSSLAIIDKLAMSFIVSSIVGGLYI